MLDWSWVRRRTLTNWGIYLALDHFACLGNDEHLSVFLDQGPLVGQPQGDTFVSCSLRPSIVNVTHRFPRYPIAYAITVLPSTAARWSQFSGNHKVSSAIIFFLCVFIPHLRRLIVCPQLLLFNDPDIDQPIATSPAISQYGQR